MTINGLPAALVYKIRNFLKFEQFSHFIVDNQGVQACKVIRRVKPKTTNSEIRL